MDEWKHLSYASSLCGNCTEVCAVKINLHELLLENRHEAVELGSGSFGERVAWKVWKTASLNRMLMNAANHRIKNWMMNRMFKAWSDHRPGLTFPARTFNQQWRARKSER